MATINPPDVPLDSNGQPDAAALRRAKESRLQAEERKAHPMDGDGSASADVKRANDQTATER